MGKIEKKKEGDFDPGCIADLAETVREQNLALRAFACLLRDADLDYFIGATYEENFKAEASNLKWGLFQLIELCVDRQDKTVSDYADQYYNSDLYIVKSAVGTIEMMEQGAFRDALARLRDVIKDLDIVINRGGELKDKALHLKDICLANIEHIEKHFGKQERR